MKRATDSLPPAKFEYDRDGRLTSASDGKTNAAFSYDVDGNLAGRKIGNQIFRFALDQLGRPTQEGTNSFWWSAAGNLENTVYESPAGPVAAIDMVFGFRPSVARGNAFMAHRTGYTADSLGKKFSAAGFQRINVERKRLDLWVIAYKPLTVADQFQPILATMS